MSTLLDEARMSISSYCVTTCKGKCCKKGSLAIPKSNWETFIGEREKEVTTRVTTSKTFMELKLPPKCPNLQSNLHCRIYENRPKGCHEFPLLLIGKTIIPIDWCPAVQNNMFDEYFEQLKEEGFSILE